MADGERGIAAVRVLGGVHAIRSDGSVVDLPSASQRRLLAVLALHSPRRLRSEWLADLVGVTPGALRTSVSRLRTAVGASVLQTASTGYSLLVDVDAVQFCQAVAEAAESADRIRGLERALAIWTGPVLEEFRGEEWADGEIARVTELHAGTVDDYADELISVRRSAEAVAALERQVALHPYRDRSRGLLIRALASAGQQADALRAFHQYRSLLIEELGTEPSAEVVRTERRVATGWDGVESEPESRSPFDAIAIPLPSALMEPAHFIGRADEMQVLAGELELVSASGLRSVLLGGEAGIGKSTLLAAFARAATSSASATVVYGRCDETGVSLQPFITVLSACVEHAPVDVLAEHVARCGGELLRVCPVLATRVPSAPSPTASDDETARFLTFEAATDLLRRIAARRPLVLVLDDLQWAEPTALLLLRHIARGLADAPVLLVCSSREPGELQPDELRLVFSDLELREARRMQLEGFDAGELADLVATATSLPTGEETQRVAEALRDETAGNALYASQLIRHWIESGRLSSDAASEDAGFANAVDIPQSLRDVVWIRVKALGDDAADVLATASVLGNEFREDVLADVADLPDRAVADALDAAVRAGLLVDAGQVRRSMRFVHALVVSALYSELGPSRRARIHGLVARAFENDADVPAADVPADVIVQLARHCALAGLPAEAQRWSTRAGDQAFDNLSPTEAAHHYRIALDIAIALDRPDAERADLLVRLGAAQHRAGDAAALDTLDQGARLARSSGAHDALIRAVFAADRGFPRYDERAPGYLANVEAAVAVADPGDTPTYARLLALLSQALSSTNDEGRCVALAREALELARQHRDPTLLARVAPPALYALWAPGSGEARSRIAAEAISAAEATGDPRLEISAHVAAYNVAVESADHVAAARSLAKVRSGVHALGEPRLRFLLGLIDVFEATMAARLTEAEALATANLELGMQIAAPDAFAMFAGQFFVIGTFGGRHDELLALVETTKNDNPTLLVFEMAWGIICAAVGREDDARAILHKGMANGFSQLPVDYFWVTTVIGYAIIAIELADAEAAAQLFPLVEPLAADVSFNGLTSQGPIAAYVGKLASILGWHDVADDNLRAALDVATSFGWTYHRATTLFALAQAQHRRLGSLDDGGRAWLTEASELCCAGGFKNWIPQIDALALEDTRA